MVVLVTAKKSGKKKRKPAALWWRCCGGGDDDLDDGGEERRSEEAADNVVLVLCGEGEAIGSCGKFTLESNDQISSLADRSVMPTLVQTHPCTANAVFGPMEAANL